jgi:hypothetical protein
MMPSMKKNVPLAVAAVAMLAVAGCSGNANSSPSTRGSVKISTAVVGQSQSQIDHVTLTISGGTPALSPAIVASLVKTDATHWSAFVSSIPAGTGYTFTVDGYGPAPTNTHLYAGSAVASITAGGTTQVTVMAQEVNPTPGATTHTPVIDSFTASAVLVQPGAAVNVAVTAHDPDGNAMTYAWTDTCAGTFAPANASATVWTAPATVPATPCQLSVRIADAINQTSVTAYLVIQVQTSTVGNGQVNAQFNTYPVVTLVKLDEYIVQAGQAPTAGVPANLPVGITADVMVTATDPDGDPLTYTYVSSCGSATFTPPGSVGPAVGNGATPNQTRFFFTDPKGNCSVSVSVSDGRGGTTTGVVVMAGAQPAASAPVITRVIAPNANGVVTPGTKYSLRVEAHDSQGTGLSFAWTNVSGTTANVVSGPANTADSYSTIDWTAPNPLVTPMSVTVRATSLGAVPNLSTTYTFVFVSNDPCFGIANGTACQGPNACISGMTCTAGVCGGGTAKVCTASDSCHLAGTCDPTSGACSNPTAADGATCSDVIAGTGTPGTPNLCTGTAAAPDHCAAGVCVGGGTVVCAAAPICQVQGACVPATGCPAPTPAPAATPCTGTNLCFQSYACNGAGTCAGSSPVSCTGAACTSGGTCNPATGTCQGGTNLPNGTACNDSNPCTTGDVCTNGVCSGTPLCPVGSSCNPTTLACVDTAVVPQVAKSLDLGSLTGVAQAADGSTYATGALFTPAKTFDGTTLTSAGAGDVFLGKYNANGTMAWVKNYGDAADQQPTGVAVTGDATVAAIGQFLGGLATLSNTGTYAIDYVLFADTTTGNVQHAVQFDLGLGGNLSAVAANPSLNLVAVCGKAVNAATSLVPGATNAGLTDIVIGVYNSAGVRQWSKQIGTAGNEECDAIAIDDVGNVFAAGKYDGTGGLSFTGTPLPNPGNSFRKHIWVAKFNGTTGAAQLQTSFGSGVGSHQPKSIAVNAAGDVVLAGLFTNTLPFGAFTVGTACVAANPGCLVSAGGSDAFVAKLTPALVPVWATGLGSISGDEARGADLDSFGNVTAVGLLYGTTTIQTVTPATVATAAVAGPTAPGASNSAAFVLKLSGATGTVTSSSAYGNTTNTINANSVVVNRYGTGAVKDAVVFGGEYAGALNFGGTSAPMSSAGTAGFLVFSKLQ